MVKILKQVNWMEPQKHALTGAYFCLSSQESNFTETAAYTVELNKRNWLSYLDVLRITARIDSVILVESEAMTRPTLNMPGSMGMCILKCTCQLFEMRISKIWFCDSRRKRGRDLPPHFKHAWFYGNVHF